MSTTRSFAIALALLISVLAAVMGRAQAPADGAQPPAAAAAEGRGRAGSPGAQELLDRMGIVGYADHMTVQPGETVSFMVSSQAPSYRADIVRLIHGDANPKGPGIKETVVDTPSNRDYPGKRQVLPMGSYITVPDHSALRVAGSFSITAWIAPTRHDPQAPGGRAPDGNQGIVAKFSSADRTGYGLVLEEDGRLALWLGAKGGEQRIRAQAALRPWVPSIPGSGRGPRPHHVTTSWYFVAASFDAANGRVVIYQQPVSEFTFDPTRTVTEQATAVKSVATSTAPLLIGAAYADGTPMKVGGHFNGKIDNPRIYGRALSRQEVEGIAQGKGPSDALASWDFSADIQS